jgi:hypothetical protein
MSDFAAIFDDWLAESVVVSNPLGAGVEGTIFDEPVFVSGVRVEHASRLVRTADGREVVSTVTLYLPATSHQIVAGARISLLDGSRTIAISVAPQTLTALFDHTVVNCE